MHLRCPHCQNPIELADLPSAGEITCAGCGSSFQLANMASTATWDNAVGKRLGKFELLGTLGQGAFGTVHKARDTELDRIVAIKIPRASNVGHDPKDLDRFLREARSVAQLRFPSIITIHEVGADNGTPYLVCDFVEGITLADLVTGRRPTFRESAKILAEVADALQYAHSLGVVHRDVKPSNIMIRPDGTPCVMDFGLAKRDAGEITMTIDGQILGTPAYMSPEQARGEGHKVDGRSDVYSLGVILYQLLSGELPFRGNKAMLLHQVLHEEPRGPRTLNDKIPRDLETIALKAMAKEPGRRYEAARALAEDLRRWLAGEPILARPVGTLQRVFRWCRRNPALASMSALAATALLAVSAVSTWLAFSEAAAFRNSEAQRLQLAAANRKSAGMALEQGTSLCEQGQVTQGMLWLAHALAIAPTDADELRWTAGANLDAWHRNLFRLRYLTPLPGQSLDLTFSPDRKWALAIGRDFKGRFFETVSGQQIGAPMDIGQIGLGLWFDSASKTMAFVDDKMTVRLRDVFTGRPHETSFIHPQAVTSLTFSRDGQTLITGGADKKLRLWNVATGQLRREPISDVGDPLELHSDPKGETFWCLSIGTCSKSSFIRQWSSRDGQPAATPLELPYLAFHLTPSPDGRHLLLLQQKGAHLLDAASLKQVGPDWNHPVNLPTFGTFSPDGKLAATGSEGGMVRVWDVKTGQSLGAPLKLLSRVGDIGFSPDSKAIYAYGTGETHVSVWDLPTAIHKNIVLPHRESICFAIYRPDGRQLATGGHEKTVRFWDPDTGVENGPVLEHPMPVLGIAFCPDGRTLRTACAHMQTESLELYSWELPSGKLLSRIPVFSRPWYIAFNQEGSMAMAVSSAREVQFWNAATGMRVHNFPFSKSPGQVRMDGGGRVLAIPSKEGGTHFYHIKSGEPITNRFTRPEVGAPVRLSPDGKLLLTVCTDNMSRIWDVETGQLAGPPLRDSTFRGWFSPDNQTIVTASLDGQGRFWRISSGMRFGQPIRQANTMLSTPFSPDGKTIVTASDDHIARVLPVPSPVEGSVERITLWVQVLSGMELDVNGNARVLGAAEWHERRSRLEKLGGPPEG